MILIRNSKGKPVNRVVITEIKPPYFKYKDLHSDTKTKARTDIFNKPSKSTITKIGRMPDTKAETIMKKEIKALYKKDPDLAIKTAKILGYKIESSKEKDVAKEMTADFAKKYKKNFGEDLSKGAIAKLQKYLESLTKASTLTKAEFGIRWVEFDRNDSMKKKQKFFKTKVARDKYADKLEKKDNFHEFDAWLDEGDD